ncbi:hypothetical protein MASR1M31_20300 [Porphyromonadaceae bacterium]
MPKCQFIDPAKVRAAGEVNLKPIPVNQYNKTIQKLEEKNFTADDLKRHHDMVVIREFETMLRGKNNGGYSGIGITIGPMPFGRTGSCRGRYERTPSMWMTLSLVRIVATAILAKSCVPLSS